MARIDQISTDSNANQFGAMTPVDTPVAAVDEIPDNPADVPESGAFNKIGKKTSGQQEQGFEWKPVYWAYIAVGALVLYTLLKK